MKAIATICFLIGCLKLGAQQPDIIQQADEEIVSEPDNDEDENDRLQLLHAFRRNPLDLNRATASELELLGLHALQISALLEHRKRFGELIALQELQAVRGWDLLTVRALIPYVKLGEHVANKVRMITGWKTGNHFILFRSSRTLEKSKGFQSSPTGKAFEGNPDKILIRYRYASPAGIQGGFTTEKDAGEVFFRGIKKRFDFASAHLYIKNTGILRALVIGDYTVQTGQGLLLWQGNGFRKGAGSLMVKRQGPLLLPYTGAGEYLFSRGIAAEWGRNAWKLLTFYSIRNLSATLEINDRGEKKISTILQSGLHRTATEMNKKNNVHHKMYGATVRYQFTAGHVGVNALQHLFSVPFTARVEPYASFDFAGKQISNLSMDYSYTVNNFHVSGEWALDHAGKLSVVNSLMAALDGKADIVLLHRSYKKEFASFQSNAFADQAVPQNESGFYAGIAVRPEKSWQFDGYVDLVLFPWLKFRTDALSHAAGFGFLARYAPSRKAEWFVRFRKEVALANSQVNAGDHFNAIQTGSRSSIRTNISLQLNREWILRQRLELARVNNQDAVIGEYGHIYYAEIFYKQPSGMGAYNFRIMLFATDGFESRIYSYEQDVLFNASVPALDGKGIRYYVNAHRTMKFGNRKSGPRADLYVRWAQTVYADKQTIGSGIDEINGNKKSEIKVQLIFSAE